jgi:hypothetical protein
VTEDCGANLRALNSGKVIEEFRFHPHERNRALAASWTNCDKVEGEDEPCRIFKELYTTENLGIEWKYLTNYVFDFEWAVSRKTKENTKFQVPEERVFCTREANNTDHQSHAGVRGNWSPHVNLYMSDDLFATTPKLMLESANTIVKTDAYMFITRSHKESDGGMVNVFVSNYKSGFERLVEAQLPDGEVNMGHSFTIMDTSEEQVFLFLENHGHASPFGSLYISDESGHYYTLSMKNVIKGTAIDFERVNSLDGTYVANVYSPNGKSGPAVIKSKKHSTKEEIGTDTEADDLDHTPEVDHLDFSEEDIIAEIAKNEGESHMQDSGDMNAKQASTNMQVHRIAESVAATEVETHVRTMITHNKGANWNVVKAPLKTSKGKSI